jgi:hypothetical protein
MIAVRLPVVVLAAALKHVARVLFRATEVEVLDLDAGWVVAVVEHPLAFDVGKCEAMMFRIGEAVSQDVVASGGVVLDAVAIGPDGAFVKFAIHLFRLLYDI